jgi:signal transduction histidine kinase
LKLFQTIPKAGTNRGLFVDDELAAAWQSVTALERNIIYSISEDKSGRLLVGSASGFYVGQRSGEFQSQQFVRAETASGYADAIGSTRAITAFRGTTFIASFGRGLERFDDGRPRVVWPVSSGGTRDLISLLADGEKRLLLGTLKDGVLIYDGQEVKSEPAFASLKGTPVRSIEQTSDGTLWFATSRGVFVCKAGSECSVAVSDFDARSLHVDKQRNEVWCATTGGGLLKIVLDPVVGPVVSQLDVEQGLPSQNVFAVLPQHDSRPGVLVGTSRGVVRYEPGLRAPGLLATRILSKRVHQPAELASGLNLEYPQNALLLEVAAINSRTFPEQFQYAFVLTDSTGKVIRQKLSRESQFAMEALGPGRYQVTTRAFTKDLVASEPLTFGFSVAKAPFPWTSTALAVLLALALLALLWAILERRRIVATSAALVDANRNLANARLDLANEAERERRRIARDLHDQTLADLRHLLLIADQLPVNGNEKFDSAVFRREIESISHEVRRICEDLSPSVLQNVGFAAALEFALANAVLHAPVEKRFKYHFVCDDMLEERARLPPNDQMQIYRIVQEAINNICRHSGATHVSMTVHCSPENDFSLTIEDDGRDFEVTGNNKSEGRGLANMRARASLIDAHISWARRVGGGMIFRLRKRGDGNGGES